MAQVTFTPIAVGDKSISPPVSGFFTSAETQSSNIEDANLRTEGVDDRIIQDSSIVSVHAATISGVAPYRYYNTGSGDISVSGGPVVIRSPGGGSSLQIDDLGTVDGETEIIRVRWSVCLRTMDPIGHPDVAGVDAPIVFFELWQTLDSSTAAISKTRRRFSFDIDATGSDDWGCASISGSHLLTSTGRLSYLSLRAGIEDGSGYFTLSEGSLVATRFKH